MVTKTFSTSWNKSVQPRKQRKYVFKAPLHIKGKLLAAKLSSELRKEHNMRSIRVRKDDKVKILRGQFKGTIGVVETVKTRASRILVQGAEVVKKDGSKAKYPIHPSNVEIVELTSKDKKRLEFKTTKAPAPKKAEAKPSAPKAGDTKE